MFNQTGENMKKTILLTLILGMCFIVPNAFAQPYSAGMAADTYDDGSGLAGVATPNDTAVAQNIHDAINLLLGTAYIKNEQVDSLQVTTGDKFWKDLSTTNNIGTWIFVGITAGNTNTLGVYEISTPGTQIPVLPPTPPGYTGFGFSGDGSLASPFVAAMSPFTSGENFAWYLKSVKPSGSTKTWSSDPFASSLYYDNAGLDHMLTYQLAALSGSTVYVKFGCTNNDVTPLSTEVCSSTSTYTFNNPYLIGFEDLAYASGKLGDEDYNDTMFLVDRLYPHTPEPATMAMLGSGIIGMLGFRRRKQS